MRSAAFAAPSITRTEPAARQESPSGTGQSQTLRYIGGSAILVRGPASGRSYSFSARQPAQRVDPRDAGPLLRTGLFRRE
jgi:hypothetical protein